MQNDGKKQWIGLALVVVATVFWSSAGYLITTIVRGSGIAAVGLAFWRVTFSFTLLLIGLAVLNPRALRVAPRDLPWLVGMGVVAVGVFQVLWVEAVMANGASVATVIQCNAPIMVTLLAWVFWREPFTWRKWAAILLASVGTILVAIPGNEGNIQITVKGLAFALGSALTYAGITLFGKKLAGSYNPFTILLYAFGSAALALLPFQIGRPIPPEISSSAVLAFAALVLLTTIAGYSLYTLGLRHMQAGVAAIIAMSEVPFASLFGYVLLGERMNLLQILGALVVVSAVLLLSLQRTRQPVLQLASQPP